MIAADATASPEPAILRARAQGEVSADTAFEQLYAIYAAPVMAWLCLRVDRADADDLFQDVWRIFYNRWRAWQMLPEMDAPSARPVLSFLFRTCHLVLQGHRRMIRRTVPLDAADGYPLAHAAESISERIALGQCLVVARNVCSPQQFDVLISKLAGVPAREVARTLGITEAVVDHHFRDAIVMLRKKLAPQRAGRRRTHG